MSAMKFLKAFAVLLLVTTGLSACGRQPDNPPVVKLNEAFSTLEERADVAWVRVDSNRAYIGFTSEGPDMESVCLGVARAMFQETGATSYAAAVEAGDENNAYGMVGYGAGGMVENTFD